MSNATTTLYRKLILLDKTVDLVSVDIKEIKESSGLDYIKAVDDNNLNISDINIANNVIRGASNTAVFIGDFNLKGSVSGETFLRAESNASGTVIVPSINDTLITKTSVDILTNKTLESPIINNNLTIDNISISGNTITSTNLNGDIILAPNGDGRVIFDADFGLGNLKIEDNTITSINPNGDIILAPNGDGKIIFDADMNFGNLNLAENTISSTNPNGDIILAPNGDGKVIFNSDIDFGNLNLAENTISSTNLDGNIELTPNGNGRVVVNSNIDIGNISIYDNSIISNNINGDIILEPNGTGKVKINYNLNVSGNIQVDGSLTESSSKRYKKDIIDLKDTENIYKLRPVKYKKIDTNEIELGFIAEEVAEYYPDLVVYRDINCKNMPDALMYSRIVVPMLNEMKKLKDRIDYLEKNYIESVNN
jgi:hypothetical protein